MIGRRPPPDANVTGPWISDARRLARHRQALMTASAEGRASRVAGAAMGRSLRSLRVAGQRASIGFPPPRSGALRARSDRRLVSWTFPCPHKIRRDGTSDTSASTARRAGAPGLAVVDRNSL